MTLLVTRLFIMVFVGSKPSEKLNQNFLESFAKIISDTELVNFVEYQLLEKPNDVLNMNEVNEIYWNVLLKTGKQNEDLSRTYQISQISSSSGICRDVNLRK